MSRFDGALGAAAGVPEISVDAMPLPTTLTARICTSYVVPFVKSVTPSVDSLVIVIGEAVVSPSVRASQVAPRSVEYSYPIMTSPPSDPAVNEISKV
jgi:hypothetical protein